MKKESPKFFYGQEQGLDEELTEIYSGLDHFWDDPQKIMFLIDLIFLLDDPDKRQLCS